MCGQDSKREQNHCGFKILNDIVKLFYRNICFFEVFSSVKNLKRYQLIKSIYYA